MKNSVTMNLKKEMYRGTLKQIMKVRGLRSISLSNYREWANEEQTTKGIHSLKLDLQDGYINIYGYGKQTKTGKYLCGETAIEDASADTYAAVYSKVMEILDNEKNIPSRVKKNILVRLSR